MSNAAESVISPVLTRGLTPPEDAAALRRTFGGFPSGVVALAAVVDGSPSVLVASSFTVGVSLDPPLCTFAVQKSSKTWRILERAERIGVSILSTEHAASVRQMAGPDTATRLDGIDLVHTHGGALLIEGSPVHLECRIVDQHPAGDHAIVVLEVIGTESHDQHSPVVVHASRFHAAVAI